MSRLPASRPTLLPTLRRLWRDPHRLQIGTDPGRAVMLELTDPACSRLLDLLDGTRTEARVLREAARVGLPPGECAELLGALRRAGFVVDAETLAPAELTEARRRRLDLEATALALRQPTRQRGPSAAEAIRRRARAQILVTGASQLAVPIASTLASSGVGHVDPDVSGVVRVHDAVPAGLLPTDAYRPRGVAAAEAVRRAAPDIDVSALRPSAATFAVIVGYVAPAALTALSLGSRRLAHLAVAVRDGIVVVGPLVRPGQTPCLNCLDLHRQDRDPAWLRVAAQLSTGPDAAEPVTATTALTGAAYAAAEVLAHIDGMAPTTLGATVEISAPGHSIRRRWSLHPQCGCRRRSRSRPATPPATHA
jgi:bacteriocin biosynthesis cyclodehydratase domain-containing protein